MVRLASARAPLEDIDSQFHRITGEQPSPTDGRFWTQYGTGGSAVGSRAAPESCLAGAVGTFFFTYNSVPCDYIACGDGIIITKQN